MAVQLFALLCGALFVGALGQTPKVRICVAKSQSAYCEEMQSYLNDTLTCVYREDRFDCMRAVHLGEADVTGTDAQGVYVAGSFPLDVIAYEEINGFPFAYKGVALVKKSLQLSSLSDLRGKRSCHTGVHRTVGWQIPVSVLQARGVMTPNCEGELATVADFFNSSCAPHEWSPDPIVDAELKKKYPSLCELCENPETCTRGDAYGGYQGSLRCLAEDRGDIAFSKTSAVEEFFDKYPEQREQMDYLCLDGSRVPASASADEACGWGVRPSNAFVFSSSRNSHSERHRIFDALHNAFVAFSPAIPQIQNQVRPDWYTKVLVSSLKVTDLRPAGDRSNWSDYLGDFRLTIDRYFGECQPKVLSFCTTSDEEQSKCTDLSTAAYARRSNVKLECVQAPDRSSCITKIRDGEADLIMLDGGDVYKAGRYFNLFPVAAEIYGDDQDAKYYAVAVVPKSSDVNSLPDLSGKRSCHTGVGRTAGWVIPVSSLINAGQILEDECDRPLAMSNFFSASCAPGASDVRYNPNLSGADKLCQQCIGDEAGENVCSRGSAERYSGYAGAFRCLAEGKGDVAFVKHTTVPEYTDGKSDLEWASGLASDDYRLLCLSGGKSEVTDYKNCSLARVPSHYAMTSDSSTKVLDAGEFLALVSRFLGATSQNFNAFKRGEDKSDLLFKDSTTSLRVAKLGSTYRAVLGEEYYKAAESIDSRICAQ